MRSFDRVVFGFALVLASTTLACSNIVAANPALDPPADNGATVATPAKTPTGHAALGATPAAPWKAPSPSPTPAPPSADPGTLGASSDALQNGVDRANEILRAERDLDPLVKDMDRRFTRLTGDVAALRVFHAKDDVAAMHTAADAALRAVDACPVDASIKHPYATRIANDLAAADEALARFTADGAYALDVEGYWDTERVLLAQKCDPAAPAAGIDCAAYRDFASTSDDAIGAMNDSELRVFEYRVAAAEGEQG